MMKKYLKYLKTKTKSLKPFDWVLIGVGLIAIIIFAILFFRKSTYITATVSVGEDSAIYGSFFDASGPKYWFANAFQKGQEEKDGLGRVQAEVLNVYSYDRTPTNKTVYLDMNLNTVYNRATNTYTYKGTPVLVGSTIKLNLDNVYAEGLVTEVQGFPGNLVKKNITVEAQIREDDPTYLGTAGTKNYLADAIQKGDTVKDNHGQQMIKVLDKRVVPAEITVNTSDGRVIKATDPMREDVFLTLEILAGKIDGRYYLLNNVPILVDQPIPFNTLTVSVFPTVTKFLSY
jgi:hypothetical protein